MNEHVAAVSFSAVKCSQWYAGYSRGNQEDQDFHVRMKPNKGMINFLLLLNYVLTVEGEGFFVFVCFCTLSLIIRVFMSIYDTRHTNDVDIIVMTKVAVMRAGAPCGRHH